MAFLPRHIIGAALACALILIFPASPAFAHDALKSSSPAKNSQVGSVDEIELEYSASVKFPFVVLHDAAGKEVLLGKPVLDGPKVLTDVPQPLPPGPYVIAWRVVSSDGHPIEGEIPFSVKGSPSPSASPSSIGGGPTASTPPQAVGSAAAAGERPAASAGVPGWIWGGLAVLVVLGAFVLIRTARRGPDREEVDAD
ncbi:copper resistance protein CopC [Nonomuraea angiospora]|uniref:Methionine-rich copper-binding protein CopC n=1 Tax=Nonomuraea angiospora TaxID=46172 RepID=A0ABR9MM17_9ACTN|nr:copper resistance protein CopC [Nonomuraea angiospora]MBE1593774.1 methionine-rich copper-binding protein CopC [Nonomuraea angiospora]